MTTTRHMYHSEDRTDLTKIRAGAQEHARTDHVVVHLHPFDSTTPDHCPDDQRGQEFHEYYAPKES